MPTAGILVIGNEILSGKVTDINSPYLCEQLREIGVDVERILTIPDVLETIASEVKAMSESYDYVFTSGGIGPTHDDLTIEGVAAAFGRSVEVDAKLERMLRSVLGDDLSEGQLKLATVPAGASLIDSDDKWFPLVVVENVYIFPGIPEGLRRKFESARDRFEGVPYVLKRVYVKRHETEIVETLNALLEEFPDLVLGSYPKIRESSYRVLLTLESRDENYVQRALDRLLADLSDGAIHKVE
ncbi:MAG: competence/damage-inducible protein A [Deltaproteobacteria bacterium]|jgi:molybdenum cofactor synthesis domain-containing protein|nr:competence/damage-inducible protein A [Deltaproteobacteria bacterium]MBW2541727.1 competence/damage-inducible protein A [Deltaproteobacteria bacterium]